MTTDKYILDEDGKPQPEPDLLKWAKWYETADRRLARTRLDRNHYVSTVFLGLDHSFAMDGPPILWETLGFSGHESLAMVRYATREQALAGHELMVEKIKRHLAN